MKFEKLHWKILEFKFNIYINLILQIFKFKLKTSEINYNFKFQL